MASNFPDEARYLLALKLFEQGRISSGKAGRLAGMGRVEFLLAASRDGVPVVDMTDEEMTEWSARSAERSALDPAGLEACRLLPLGCRYRGRLQGG
ncbi:MAG: UPF0175 family protein [Sulfuritalea sp.]|nr:UPF0175 family protein [Sulfuritalea sp.]